jgi:ribosomal protein S17E
MNDLVKIGKVLNIDHHIPKGYENIVYVNPRLHNKHAYIPVSYLCHKIYTKFSDDMMWIAGIGVLGDHAVKNCLDLFQNIKRNYPELIGKAELIDEKLYENSLIGKLVRMVDSGRIVIGARGSLKTVEILINAKTFHDVLENKQLKKWNEISEKEFDRIIADFWKNRKILNNVMFYEIKSKYQFKSAVAGYLQQSFDDKILAVGQKEGIMLDVSLRRGMKVDTDLAELAMMVVGSIPGSSGGGHEAASAVRIPFNKKSRLLELLSSQKKA